MHNLSHTFPAIVISTLLLQPNVSFAADAPAPAHRTVKQKSYGAQVGEKSLNGITNIGTAWLEIPKNVVKTTKETNIIYGMIGGLGMGVFNTLGRLGTGVFDLVSAPIPTDPLVSPVRAWDDFDTKTAYGVQYHLEEPTNQMPTN
ncbi:MAG: exosortase system-associated protein, TIGR04073 family [Methylococcales bacterium]